MFGRKKTLGFGSKPRTAEVVNQEYNNHALNMGHKLRVLSDLEDEIDQHKEAMHQLASEGRALASVPPTITPKEAPAEVQS